MDIEGSHRSVEPVVEIIAGMLRSALEWEDEHNISSGDADPEGGNR